MSQLTFKQYIESREQLLKVVKKPPVVIHEHSVVKYCSIPVNEADGENKVTVHLKPKNKMIVEWDYANKESPVPLSIKFEGVIGLDSEDTFEPCWSPSKVYDWISKNAIK